MTLRRAGILPVVFLAALALAGSAVFARGARGGGGGSYGPGGGRGGQSHIQRRGAGGGGRGGTAPQGGAAYRSSPARRGLGGTGFGSPGLGRGQHQRQNQYQYQQRHRGEEQSRARHRWGYDTTNEETLSGRVIEDPARGQGEGIENTLRLRTRQGEEVRLHLGPPWYQDGLGLRPQPGDEITAVGARWREQEQTQNQNRNQIMARELNWNGQTYRLRNGEGIPLWSGADRPEWSGYAGMWNGSRFEEISGEIQGIERVSPGGGDMGRGVVLRLRTRERERDRERLRQQDGTRDQERLRERERETMRVHLGPYWFVEDSIPGLRVGEQITVRGTQADWSGDQVLIASEMERNRERIRLRTREGRPEWAGGWQNWDGWGPGARYGELYDPTRVQTIAGRVERVGQGTPTEGMGRGLMLRLRTREQEQVRAHLGPVWFAEQFDLAPEPGDELTLTGSVVEMNGRQVMMVTEVVANQRRVRIRDQNGTPIWAGRGPGEPERAEQHIGAPTPPAAPAGGAAAG